MVALPNYLAITSGSPRSEYSTNTMEAYCARRASAYGVGETKARRREISADAYLFLYKELVGLSGNRTYCWPSMEYLTVTLETSEGTLKRWMKELERADLIRRKPRPGGQTSLTYITAYLEADYDTKLGASHNDGRDDASEVRPSGNRPQPVEPLTLGEPLTPSTSQSAQLVQPPVFFAPEQEIASDHSARSEVISHTIKKQKFKNPPGCGGASIQLAQSQSEMLDETDIAGVLRDEEVQDPVTLVELQNKPIEELRALSQYLDKQTNVHCRPGLFVWLARQDFGAKLLAGRQQHKNQQCKGSKKQPNCTNKSNQSSFSELEREPVRVELAEVWQKVLDQVSRLLPKAVFDVWIKPTSLVVLEDVVAVVAVPNVFVRQEIEQAYQVHLEEALSQVCARPITIQAVIV